MNLSVIKDLLTNNRAGKLGALYLACACIGLALLLSAVPNQPVRAATSIANWQKGVTIQANSATDLSGSSSDAAITQAKQTNANYITIIIPLQQDNIYSTYIYRASFTPTDASIAHAAATAHSQGVKVALKIHLDPQDGQWRANINPGDRTTWYQNYSNMLNYYASLAQQNGIEELVVGAELISMATDTSNPDNTVQWHNMISQVRQRYSGLLTYSANWGGSYFTEEFDHIKFWDALDFIGISAYFGLANYNNPSVSDVMNAWNNWNTSKIQPFQQSTGKPVLFTEIGYRSVDGSLINPWDYNHQGNYNSQEQVNGIQALVQYWSNYSWFAGIQYWAWKTNPNCCGAGDTMYEVQNKPAQSTMASLFNSATGGGTTPPPTTPAFMLLSSSVTPATGAPGTNFGLNASINATAAATVLIDMEVYNAAGNRVYQQVVNNQTFAANETKNYSLNWATSASQATGQYTLSIGVFKSDWSSNYTWSSVAASFAIATGASSPTPTPTATPTATPKPGPTPTPGATPTPVPSTYTLAIWWPSPGVTLQGVQTIKAKVNDLDLSQYTMTWSVDNGRQSGSMTDQLNEGAHKEATINTSSWTWNGKGPYTITFVAKSLSGQVIASNSVQVNVQ